MGRPVPRACGWEFQVSLNYQVLQYSLQKIFALINYSKSKFIRKPHLSESTVLSVFPSKARGRAPGPWRQPLGLKRTFLSYISDYYQMCHSVPIGSFSRCPPEGASHIRWKSGAAGVEMVNWSQESQVSRLTLHSLSAADDGVQDLLLLVLGCMCAI